MISKHLNTSSLSQPTILGSYLTQAGAASSSPSSLSLKFGNLSKILLISDWVDMYSRVAWRIDARLMLIVGRIPRASRRVSIKRWLKTFFISSNKVVQKW